MFSKAQFQTRSSHLTKIVIGNYLQQQQYHGSSTTADVQQQRSSDKFTKTLFQTVAKIKL